MLLRVKLFETRVYFESSLLESDTDANSGSSLAENFQRFWDHSGCSELQLFYSPFPLCGE